MEENGGYKIRDQYAIHFVTFTVVGWVDIFTRRETKQIIIDSLKYCIENKGLILYAYVIMTNHLHLIVQANKGSAVLSDIIRDFKKFTSKQIIEWMNKSNKESRKEWMQMVFKYHAKLNSSNSEYQVWQQHNRPKVILLPRFARQKLNYIHYNAVRAGYVDKPEDYIYSSFRSYYCEDREIILPVTILDFGSEEGFIFAV
ncbi:MAG: transposase [Saprospiraceae bacterium]|nr:transposase [Saprospiraceae bacterium]